MAGARPKEMISCFVFYYSKELISFCNSLKNGMDNGRKKIPRKKNCGGRRSARRGEGVDGDIESYIMSDGLFSFSFY